MKQFESIEADIQRLFPEVLSEYSEVMGVPENLLVRFTDVECVEGDEGYSPYPEIIEKGGRDLTLQCNLSGLQDGWDLIFGDEAGIDTETSRKIYIATGLAWVGLVHIALDAKESRSEQSRAGLHRVARVMEQLQDAEILKEKVKELEIAEKIESSIYPMQITHDDVQLINRLRFGLGVGYLVNNIDHRIRDKASLAFTENFSHDLSRMGKDLISFALGLGLDKNIDPDIYKQRGISKAFHTFYFAGIIPMDMSDIMRT